MYDLATDIRVMTLKPLFLFPLISTIAMFPVFPVFPVFFCGFLKCS